MRKALYHKNLAKLTYWRRKPDNGTLTETWEQAHIVGLNEKEARYHLARHMERTEDIQTLEIC